MGQCSSGGISATFAVIDVGALGACIWLFFRTAPKAQIIGQLVLIKNGLVLLDATHIYLCFLALGVAGSFAQASVLTASSVLGAVVSIVPARLGICEGAAALLAPFIALAPASAFLATSFNRIVGLAIMAPAALFLGVRRDKAYQPVNQ